MSDQASSSSVRVIVIAIVAVVVGLLVVAVVAASFWTLGIQSVEITPPPGVDPLNP